MRKERGFVAWKDMENIDLSRVGAPFAEHRGTRCRSWLDRVGGAWSSNNRQVYR